MSSKKDIPRIKRSDFTVGYLHGDLPFEYHHELARGSDVPAAVPSGGYGQEHCLRG
jgi:hypothetical protein